jgi:hypothetical protein
MVQWNIVIRQDMQLQICNHKREGEGLVEGGGLRPEARGPHGPIAPNLFGWLRVVNSWTDRLEVLWFQLLASNFFYTIFQHPTVGPNVCVCVSRVESWKLELGTSPVRLDWIYIYWLATWPDLTFACHMAMWGRLYFARFLLQFMFVLVYKI